MFCRFLLLGAADCRGAEPENAPLVRERSRVQSSLAAPSISSERSTHLCSFTSFATPLVVHGGAARVANGSNDPSLRRPASHEVAGAYPRTFAFEFEALRLRRAGRRSGRRSEVSITSEIMSHEVSTILCAGPKPQPMRLNSDHAAARAGCTGSALKREFA